jgi:hypothetical protein
MVRPVVFDRLPPIAAGFAALLLVLLCSACGVRKGAPDWIGEDAAVVRCTVSGPNLALPRLFADLPSPAVPTGLYARTMDPIALDQLGFERDRVVCASLQAPAAAELERAQAAIAELHAERRELIKSTRKLGGCRCAYADALQLRALVPGCINTPTQLDCALEPEPLDHLRELLAPFEAKLASTHVPRTHWRLAGRTDRPGRFMARSEQVLARHLGGSELFVAKTPLPPQRGAALIAGLLALEHVVAVVRQDGGRALLVIREIGDELVLDHFAYTDWQALGAGRVDAELYALLGHLDDAQLPRYRAALERPSERRELLMKPRKGYLVELDHAGLERVDQALLVAAEFGRLSYDEAGERRELPARMVDRLGYQVPYGTEGEVLTARLELSEAGRGWLAAVAGQTPLEAATSLGQADVVPVFAAAEPGFAAQFVLRGQAIEQMLFAGPPGLPKLLLAIAAADPKALAGELDDFRVELPTGPLPGGFPSRPGVTELRERLSIAAHRLAVKLEDRGRVLALELKRR